MRRSGLVLGVLLLAVQASGQDEITIGEDEPSIFPMAPQVDEYTVVKGDTLWDISARVVGDPTLWSTVWALNPEITNPNWIYPGDIVRFYPSRVPLPVYTELVASRLPSLGPSVVDLSPQAEESPQAAGSLQVMPGARVDQTPSYLVTTLMTGQELQEAGVLANAAPDRMLLDTGDKIFVRQTRLAGGVPLKKGDRMLVYRRGLPVTHPHTGAAFGYITLLTGMADVDELRGELVVAHMVKTLGQVERGQYVTALTYDPYVKLVPKVTTQKIEANVVAVADGGYRVASQEMIVFIDKGTEAGLERGNRLTVIAHGDAYKGNDAVPEESIGTIHVLDVRKQVAACLVVRASREIPLGARVRSGSGSALPTQAMQSQP